MATTTSVTVASHIMSEILSAAALMPLRANHVARYLVNVSSIDGIAAEDRKIPKLNAIAEAVDDAEGVEFNDFEEFDYGSPITLTPTGKVQGVAPTIKALRRRMPGLTRDQVIQAVANGNPAVVPMLVEIYNEILAAHGDALERAVCAEFVNASQSAGTTTQPMSFANLINARLQVLDNDTDGSPGPLVCVLDERGLFDLTSELLTGSGSGIVSVFANGYADSFLDELGGLVPGPTPRHSLFGMPIYRGASSLMSTANAGVDRVGAVFRLGRGETAGAGSLRGFAEICEGHSPSISLELDVAGDIAEAIGRHEWDVGEHTDEYICKIIYDID